MKRRVFPPIEDIEDYDAFTPRIPGVLPYIASADTNRFIEEIPEEDLVLEAAANRKQSRGSKYKSGRKASRHKVAR